MCNDYDIKRKMMLNQLIQYTKQVQMIYTYSVNTSQKAIVQADNTYTTLKLETTLCLKQHKDEYKF